MEDTKKVYFRLKDYTLMYTACPSMSMLMELMNSKIDGTYRVVSPDVNTVIVGQVPCLVASRLWPNKAVEHKRIMVPHHWIGRSTFEEIARYLLRKESNSFYAEYVLATWLRNLNPELWTSDDTSGFI